MLASFPTEAKSDIPIHNNWYPLLPALSPLPSPSISQSHLSSLSLPLHYLRNSRWMGEKYDGIRLCWNALKKTAYLNKYEFDVKIVENRRRG